MQREDLRKSEMGKAKIARNDYNRVLGCIISRCRAWIARVLHRVSGRCGCSEAATNAYQVFYFYWLQDLEDIMFQATHDPIPQNHICAVLYTKQLLINK